MPNDESTHPFVLLDRAGTHAAEEAAAARESDPPPARRRRPRQERPIRSVTIDPEVRTIGD